MGRHRRSDSGTASRLPAASGAHPRHGGRRRLALRTGLLGAAAVLTAGGVAVAAGITPQNPFSPVGGSGESARAAGPTEVAVPDYYSPSPTAAERGTPSASRRGGHSSSPSPSASVTRTPTASKSHSSAAPSTSEPTETATPSRRPTSATPSERPTSATPTRSADTQSAEEAEVLRLVNQEREQAGCSPVTADPGLGDLAGDFSQDMAVRGFFDHTDPDGDDPWDRARQRGIDNLGAENIARGQSSAQAVMDSWMQSSGHRANILNCDYRTLGVGLYTADGDHWWTQEFGF